MTEGGTSEGEYREQGNAEYRSGNYLKAAALYTKALKKNPECAPLYSNRSIALLQLNKLPKALADAEMCISLAPTWDKGHFRKGMVLEALNRLEDALDSYRAALACSEVDGMPSNKQAESKIRNIQRLLRQREK